MLLTPPTPPTSTARPDGDPRPRDRLARLSRNPAAGRRTRLPSSAALRAAVSVTVPLRPGAQLSPVPKAGARPEPLPQSVLVVRP